jgi:hypothetical protein
MALYLGCHVQALDDEIGSNLQEFSISSDIFLVPCVHDGIRIHFDNPVNELEIEGINFCREICIFLDKLSPQEFTDIFWLSLGGLLEWAFLDQEAAGIEAKIVIQDDNWAHLLQ